MMRSSERRRRARRRAEMWANIGVGVVIGITSLGAVGMVVILLCAAVLNMSGGF